MSVRLCVRLEGRGYTGAPGNGHKGKPSHPTPPPIFALVISSGRNSSRAANWLACVFIDAAAQPFPSDHKRMLKHQTDPLHTPEGSLDTFSPSVCGRSFRLIFRPLPYKDTQSCSSAIGRAHQPAGILLFNSFAAEFNLFRPRRNNAAAVF